MHNQLSMVSSYQTTVRHSEKAQRWYTVVGAIKPKACNSNRHFINYTSHCAFGSLLVFNGVTFSAQFKIPLESLSRQIFHITSAAPHPTLPLFSCTSLSWWTTMLSPQRSSALKTNDQTFNYNNIEHKTPLIYKISTPWAVKRISKYIQLFYNICFKQYSLHLTVHMKQKVEGNINTVKFPLPKKTKMKALEIHIHILLSLKLGSSPSQISKAP